MITTGLKMMPKELVRHLIGTKFYGCLVHNLIRTGGLKHNKDE